MVSLAAKLYAINATVVLINNNGGGIFSFLSQSELAQPESDVEDLFERIFATPTGIEFQHAVTMYGGNYTQPTNWSGFDSAFRDSLDRPGLTVIEVRTDRTMNRTQHSEVWSHVSRTLKGSDQIPVA